MILIGSALLIISGGIVGWYASHRLKIRVDFIEQYIRFIRFAETKIRYSACNLIQIIDSYYENEYISKFLNLCSKNVKQGEDFPAAWNLAVDSIPKEYGLNESDIPIIKKFGYELGSSDIEGQVSYCRLNEELMSVRLDEARKEKDKKSKVYIMLGIFSGALLVMLLN